MKFFVITTFILSFYSFGQQPTIGLILSTSESAEGYTLFTPEKNNFVFLIDNCGQVVNSWEFSEKPALTCYLLENGNLLRAGQDSLEIRDWNNNLLWSFGTTANGFPQHHDIEPLPNGNILIVSKETFDNTELIELGRNPALGNTSFTLDVIYELQPIGTNDAQLVWSWKFSDHLIQDFDVTKNNYGVVANAPELLNINFDNAQAIDYTHVNAIDYNPLLDEILITARHVSEVFIIDHSTSTLEAASHTGGSKGKGGDFIYRWGNPQMYEGGNASDQKLHFPHDGKWVEEGCPNAGKLSVFNNYGDGVALASSVHVFAPTILNDVYQMNGSTYSPLNYSWSWSGNLLGNMFFESKKCGMMELQNGNHLVCENSTGTLFEIGANDSIVWIYKNPSGANGTIFQQEESVGPNSNILFRGERYPPDFVGFIGKDLTPIGTIENENEESDNCLIAANIEDQSIDDFLVVNPVISNNLHFNKAITCDELLLVDLNGHVQKQILHFSGQSVELNTVAGIYFLKIRKGNVLSTQKLIIL